MTLTRLESFPFDSRYDGYDDNGYPVYDRAVGAHTMRDVFAHFFSDGVFSDTSYPFRLTKAASGLAVTVNPGVIIINGGWGILPEQTTLTLATGTTAGVIKYAVFARYDNNDEHRTIYLRTDASSAGGAVPEPSTTEANVTEYRIGYVTVPSNATDLSSATVTNEVGTSMCPYAVPLFNIDAAEVLEDLRNDAQAAYDKYYELLASSIDDTTAGNLQNQIDAQDARINELENKTTPLSDAIDSDSDATMGVAATPKAVKTAIEPRPGKDLFVYSWAELSEMSADAVTNPDDYAYLIGQTKDVMIAGYGIYAFQLVAIGHNALNAGGTAGFTFMAESAITTRAMNSSITTSGGWASMTMRTWLSETLLAAMPTTLTDYIRAAKTSYSTAANSSLVTCSDKLWIASEKEVFGSSSYDSAGTQFEYFASGNSKIKYKGTSVISWWLRSVYSSSAFRGVDANGAAADLSVSNNTYGVVPCFCI